MDYRKAINELLKRADDKMLRRFWLLLIGAMGNDIW